MNWLELVLLTILAAVFGAALGAFAWQMYELFVVTDAMFDALESALEARQ